VVAINQNDLDLNQISDAALRLALARALERNAFIEGLLVDINRAIRHSEEWVLPIQEETYVMIAVNAGAEYESVSEYRQYYSYVEEDKQKHEEERIGYKYPHECPFFSEMFLYDLFGKDEARTILSLFNSVRRLSSEETGEIHDRANRQNSLVIQAQNVSHYEKQIEKAKRYLDAFDDPKSWITPKKTKEEYQSDLEEAQKRLIQSATDLAHSVQWHFEN